ncbi:MAG: endolytic transglycosylase MltG [Tenericutes bacterium]|nr:endolytic transglycosylase MltG [Mycoplasmatota bacterium]
MEKQGRKLKKKFKIILVLVAILLIGIATLLGTYCYFKSPVSNDKKEVSIVIENGSTISDIATLLKKKGLIKNENFFKLYVKLKKVSNVYAAKYYFSPSMNLDEIINTLNEGGYNENEISITFKEGINMRGIAKLIKENTSNSEDDVYKKLKDEKYLNSIIEKYWFLTDDIKNSKIYYSLEGYLFPDTYRFNSKDVTVEEIFNKMLDQMEKELNKYKKQIENSKYSVHELITLASITQSEGYNEDDFKNIASVFYNRLKTGMALGSCITSYYGVKKDMTDELLQKDIDASNPYNTRGNNPVSFPVGPISMPGAKALDATLDPIETSYYFFVSDKNNKLYFTKTLNEHERMITKLQNEGLWLEW